MTLNVIKANVDHKQNESQRKMDWHLFWTAAIVIVSLGSLIMGCFRSLSGDIKTIDQRLSRLEGAFEERGRWESRRTGA